MSSPPTQESPASASLASFPFKDSTSSWHAWCSLQWTLALSLHLLAFIAAYTTGAALRFDFRVPPWMINVFWTTLPWVLLLKVFVFFAARQYRAWWRHVSFPDLLSLTCAALVSSACVIVVNHFHWLPRFVPRVVLLIDCACTILFVGALRSAWRVLNECVSPWIHQRKYGRALLVGADPADKILAVHLHSHPQLPFRICGYLDRQPLWRGQSFAGMPVLGSLDEFADVARRRRISEVVAIAGSLPGRELRRLRRQCEEAGLNLHLLPPLSQLVSGHKHLPLKPIDVEALLHRPTVRLHEDGIRDCLENAVIAVTGAGGSIGSEVCRQLLAFRPDRLILVDRSEPSLFHVDLELRGRAAGTEVKPFLGDVTDRCRMQRLFVEHRPTIVFHVAAHKHVPLLESHAGEAVKNNLFGTANLVDLSEAFGVERLVFVSTDKAVNPSSIMGVTKRLAENYALSSLEQSPTRSVAVRFGNVLGSVGSVVPLFQDQIRHGGPITITHPKMQRFFMTIPEAARLVLQACALGRGGEIFVLDMGAPVRIIDLARDMIRMTGLPEHAIDITYVGVRPGEKLYEELYFDDEEPLATSHPKIFSARHRPISRETMRRCLEELRPLVYGDDRTLIGRLGDWVPEYSPPDASSSPADGLDETEEVATVVVGSPSSTHDKPRQPR